MRRVIRGVTAVVVVMLTSISAASAAAVPQAFTGSLTYTVHYDQLNSPQAASKSPQTPYQSAYDETITLSKLVFVRDASQPAGYSYAYRLTTGDVQLNATPYMMATYDGDGQTCNSTTTSSLKSSKPQSGHLGPLSPHSSSWTAQVIASGESTTQFSNCSGGSSSGPVSLVAGFPESPYNGSNGTIQIHWSDDSAGSSTQAASHTTAQGKLRATCLVPKLVGKTLSAAKKELAAAWCHLGNVRHSSFARVPKGKIGSQSPSAGAVWPAGGVAVVVSTGR